MHVNVITMHSFTAFITFRKNMESNVNSTVFDNKMMCFSLLMPGEWGIMEFNPSNNLLSISLLSLLISEIRIFIIIILCSGLKFIYKALEKIG